jgi:hypothetical protein
MYDAPNSSPQAAKFFTHQGIKIKKKKKKKTKLHGVSM